MGHHRVQCLDVCLCLSMPSCKHTCKCVCVYTVCLPSLRFLCKADLFHNCESVTMATEQSHSLHFSDASTCACASLRHPNFCNANFVS